MPMPRTDRGFYEPIGERMRLARLDRGAKQEHIAPALGVSQQQLGKYERGMNAISLAVLSDFAELLRLPMEWLIRGEAREKAEQSIRPAPARLTVHEQELVNAYRHIENPDDRRVLRRMADIMAQGSEAFATDPKQHHE